MADTDRERIIDLCLEVTQKCPLECLHCSSESGPECTTYFPQKEAKNIIREASELGLEEISISGGEPLEYPYLDEILKTAEKNGLDIRLYTSGNTLDNGKVRNLGQKDIKRLSSLGVSKFIFSLLGSTPETHDDLTSSEGAFHNTIESIKASVLSGKQTELHFVLMRPNFSELKDVFDLSDQLDVDQVSILRFVPQGRGGKNRKALSLTKRQKENLKQHLEEIASPEYAPRLGAPFNPLQISEPAQCNAGQGKVCIQPDGSAHPCEAMKQIHEGINILNTSLEEFIKETYGSSFLSRMHGEGPKEFDRDAGCIAQSVIQNQSCDTKLDPINTRTHTH